MRYSTEPRDGKYGKRYGFMSVSNEYSQKCLANATECRDVTNSWLDHKLPLAGLWLILVEVILSKERIQKYSFFLISRKMKPREM